MGEIKRLVIGETKDMFPKLKTIIGKVKTWAAKVVESIFKALSGLSFVLTLKILLTANLKNSLIKGSTYISPITARKESWNPTS
jgi:hypothetical protein